MRFHNHPKNISLNYDSVFLKILFREILLKENVNFEKKALNNYMVPVSECETLYVNQNKVALLIGPILLSHFSQIPFFSRIQPAGQQSTV